MCQSVNYLSSNRDWLLFSPFSIFLYSKFRNWMVVGYVYDRYSLPQKISLILWILMMNGTHGRRISLPSLDGTLLTKVSTHYHTWCRVRLVTILPSLSEGCLKRRKRRGRYVQQLHPFHLRCNTLDTAQNDNEFNSHNFRTYIPTHFSTVHYM